MSGRAVLLHGVVVVAALVPVSCSTSTDAAPGAPGADLTEAAQVAPQGWVSASTDGPDTAGSQAAAVVGCEDERPVLAGGFLVDRSDDSVPSPSIRVVRSAPDPVDPGGAPRRWKTIGATGGQEERRGRTTVWARCGDSVGAFDGATVVEATAAGPTDAGTSAGVTARCPTGTALTGGGGSVEMSDGSLVPRQYFLTGTFPSDEHGSVPPDGSSPGAWTAVGSTGGSPLDGSVVRAVAICVPGVAPSVHVESIEGPSAPRSSVAATATCPDGSRVLAGGAVADLVTGDPPPQGVHLRASMPTSTSGDDTSDGWIATANSGGQIAVGARTTALVLCGAPA